VIATIILAWSETPALRPGEEKCTFSQLDKTVIFYRRTRVGREDCLLDS